MAGREDVLDLALAFAGRALTEGGRRGPPSCVRPPGTGGQASSEMG